MNLNTLEFLGAVIMAAGLLQGCSGIGTASGGASPPPRLNDSAWTLDSLPGTSTLPAAQVTLRFEGGRATGSDGCNHWATNFTADNERLAFGPRRTSTHWPARSRQVSWQGLSTACSMTHAPTA